MRNNMAASTRARLSEHDFAIPELRKFPIQSERQAVVALTYAQWPQNATWKARVEAAVYAAYPQLKPTAAQKRAGKVAKPKKQRRARNPQFTLGQMAYLDNELDPVTIVNKSGSKYVVQAASGILTVPSSRLRGGTRAANVPRGPRRKRHSAPVRKTNAGGLQQRVATLMQSQGYQLTKQGSSIYAYKAHDLRAAKLRYKISASGVCIETKSGTHWTQSRAYQAVSLSLALTKLGG